MTLFDIQDATFQKSYHTQAFEHVTWKWESGQAWAVVGPSGSGKTTFAEFLAGKILARKGTIDCSIGRDAIHYLSFEEDSQQFHYQNYYYQQRFQASEADLAITVQEYLGKDQIVEVPRHFIDIELLKPLSLIKLSNGQNRKVRLVKTLSSSPKALLLDKPFTGLDNASRQELGLLLDHLVKEEVALFLIDELQFLPSCITHVLELESCALSWQGRKEDYHPKETKGNFSTEQNLIQLPSENLVYTNLLKVNKLKIEYGGSEILKSIDWEIRQGERWLLKGPNGAGKTTLLGVIYADVPQAYSQDIVQFDKARGSGESIWDIKQKIGFYSPELQYYFKHDLSIEEVISTGLTDKLYLQRENTPEEAKVIESHLAFVGLAEKKNKPFQQQGKSIQNVVLLLRSLIKNPPLLLWDEPFLSLNESDKTMCKHLLQRYLSQKNCTLVIISHQEEEIRDLIDHTLELDNGKWK